MRAYVTGATGFIGGRLASSLLTDGHDVVVLARTPEKAAELERRGATVAKGDVTDDVSRLAEGMAGAEVVFHLAAIYEVGTADPEHMERVNVEGARTVIDAARAAGVATVVHCSSVAALGATQPGQVGDEDHLDGYEGGFASVYERTKHEAHLLALDAAERGQDVRIGCPNGVYGPDDTSMLGWMLKAWARGLVPFVPFADTEFGFVHVDDVAAGLRAIHERGRSGRVYVLGGEVSTIRGLLEEAARVAGRRAPRGRLPDWIARASAPVSPPLLRWLGMPPYLVREGLETMNGRGWAYRSTRAERELGYQWRPLAEGLRETVVWARESRLRAG